MRILVEPERLQDLAHRFRALASELTAARSRAEGTYRGINWDASEKPVIEAQVALMSSQLNTLLLQAEGLAVFLEGRAQAFSLADSQYQGGTATDSLAGTLGASWDYLTNLRVAFPGSQLNGNWRLGSLLGGSSALGLVMVPAAGGAAVVGLAPLSGLSAAFSNFVERVWNWLHGYGWRTNAELSSGAQPVASSTPRQPADSRATQEASASTQTAAPDNPSASASAETQWWRDVPLQSQQDLTYNGKPTDYGCSPTSVSMVLDYWHQQDARNASVSAQALLNTNVGQRQFHASGMSAADLLDEVKGLGYTTTQANVNSSLDALKGAVSKGPVVAIVKLGMTSSGNNHAVVVTGISGDNHVRINDPWDGQAHTYSWDDFSRSWGANFGSDAPKNNFVEIRP